MTRRPRRYGRNGLLTMMRRRLGPKINMLLICREGSLHQPLPGRLERSIYGRRAHFRESNCQTDMNFLAKVSFGRGGTVCQQLKSWAWWAKLKTDKVA